MAKRKVRRQRRIEDLNRHSPHDAGPTKCFADDCTETATTTVSIDGKQYKVCAPHAELVMIQEGRRAKHRRQQDDVDDIERRRQTEEALGLR